jgi:lysozyme family protein
MVNLVALKDANERRFKNARLTRNYASIARRLIEPTAKARYQLVSQRTGVPWAVIAVIHMRESSQDWARSLAQGDPWNRVSVHVPAGRGPFNSWADAAVDALVNCHPYIARNKDWSIGGTLTRLEEYNGLGYAAKGRPSPYIWAGTDQYVSGKYVRDGVYDPNHVDTQPGCANLLMTMMSMDPTITFTGIAIMQSPTLATPGPPTEKPMTSSPPSITNPAKGSIGAFIANLFAKIFGRKP